jgi:hypothetical protein
MSYRSNRAWAAFAAVVVAGLFAPSRASAQVIYEPVRYQYGDQLHYYYGGSDPAMHRFANWGSAERTWGRINGWEWAAGDIDSHREVSDGPPRVYTDQLPYRNATFFGYTATDARNTAYNNVPRYFRKSDLLRAGIPQADGTLVVPAQAVPVPAVVITPRATRPATSPQPILIIPKKALEPKSTPQTAVASR